MILSGNRIGKLKAESSEISFHNKKFTSIFFLFHKKSQIKRHLFCVDFFYNKNDCYTYLCTTHRRQKEHFELVSCLAVTANGQSGDIVLYICTYSVCIELSVVFYIAILYTSKVTHSVEIYI